MLNYNFYSKKLASFSKEMGLTFPLSNSKNFPFILTPREMLASEALFHCLLFWESTKSTDPTLANLCIMASRAVDMALAENDDSLAAALDLCFSTVYEFGVPCVKAKRMLL